MTSYQLIRVKSDQFWQPAFAQLSEHDLPPGVRTWGTFYGLFGLSRRELLLAVHLDEGATTADWLASAGLQVTDSRDLEPTARPLEFEPLSRPGLYVWRFFDIAASDVEEFVTLSTTAWRSFETDAEFASHPYGLFRSPEQAGSVSMTLVTWYDSLASWERSRSPGDEARENFRRRGVLTQESIAFATRLTGDGRTNAANAG